MSDHSDRIDHCDDCDDQRDNDRSLAYEIAKIEAATSVVCTVTMSNSGEVAEALHRATIAAANYLEATFLEDLESADEEAPADPTTD